jgi:hypothetical protein
MQRPSTGPEANQLQDLLDVGKADALQVLLDEVQRRSDDPTLGRQRKLAERVRA